MLKELSVAGVSPNTLPSNYVIVRNVGSGAKLVHIKRLCGDKASAKEIEVRSPVHLPFDELQLGDLPLDLAV